MNHKTRIKAQNRLYHVIIATFHPRGMAARWFDGSNNTTYVCYDRGTQNPLFTITAQEITGLSDEELLERLETEYAIVNVQGLITNTGYKS